ncbi:Putative phage protein [Sodalis praecaptivus]|uniref:Putative phage protein n=1 Tax=Sodalis praecaptivus TaxID=1239307 RepID=W0HYI3_9GAMM|nr:hypothetical protein [Sodalis praecaptivus]AHF77562.1 Putative phage protein [Sodalis praecaptivus]
MWREARLAFTDSVGALECSVISAHPWVYGLGQQTENGAYLSPVNAITFLAQKLTGLGNATDIVIMMVAGKTHENFMANLNPLIEVFPAPTFTQVKRQAQAAAELARAKMQIPATYGNGMPDVSRLSIPTSRQAITAAAVEAAQVDAAAAVDMVSLKQQLSDFTKQRDGLMGDIASGLDALQGKSAKAWVFTATADLPTALLALVKDIPMPSAVYTAAMMLVGDNLDGIKGMIHDIDPDAGA